ncbi:molybdopterin cofactor-binding domain-containing protein [Dongia sp.]|uniref:xanthine dehydrogenase family protein molybdopterin-binding subunit n=1 Tax=Dongia sp. TaxID=1977262 RepID=UPI0035AEEA4F
MTTNALPKSLLDNQALGRWVSFAEPGRALIRSGKVELGQGIATALAQIAAEELELDLGRIDLAAADTDLGPDEGLTAGSQSVEISGAALRLAMAQARDALLRAAAHRLGCDPKDLACRDGTILAGNAATSLDFWQLAADIDWQQPVTGTVPVRLRQHYALVGQSVPRIDLAARILNGGFIQDLLPPDVLHARILRQPFRLARLKEIDTAWLTRRYPDLTFLRQADFLALTGDDEYRVHAAQLDADKFVTWEEVPDLWQPATVAPAKQTTLGSTPPVAKTFTACYSRAYIAHASIGPSCALAKYADGHLIIRSHSQGIFPLKGQIGKILGLAPDRVRVIHVPGAGCYGHNGADDAALDAAIVALRHPGRTIRVQWSRTDELSRAPLGAAMSARIDAGLDAEGRITHWRTNVISAPHAQRPGFGGEVNLTSAEALDPGRLPKAIDDLPEIAGGGASRNATPIYDLPHREINVALDTSSPIRTSSLRSLGAHLNVFAIESAMDELAALAGADPLDFRLAHLTDPRCRAVLQGAADMSCWPGGHEIGTGRGMGLAVARYKNKGAWLAAVAEVTVDEMVRVEKLWLCVDAGLLINPAGARNQIEGGTVQAVSWALKEGIQPEDGRVAALTWEDYPILKFSEVPQIETRFIIDPAASPLGTGEASQGPVTAAIGNAVARALGQRIRDLPLIRDRLVAALDAL